MAVPKQKGTRSRRGHRRAKQNIKEKNLMECDNCGASKLNHRACGECGFYKGEQVVEVNKNDEEEQ